MSVFMVSCEAEDLTDTNLYRLPDRLLAVLPGNLSLDRHYSKLDVRHCHRFYGDVKTTSNTRCCGCF